MRALELLVRASRNDDEVSSQGSSLDFPRPFGQCQVRGAIFGDLVDFGEFDRFAAHDPPKKKKW
jgi:hypothetical protein